MRKRARGSSAAIAQLHRQVVAPLGREPVLRVQANTPSTSLPARSSETEDALPTVATPAFSWERRTGSGTVRLMKDVIWSGRPELRRPVMVCAFRGWNDAGEAASAAVSFIRDSVDSRDVASINPEEFFDFTAVRPNIRLTEESTREIDWPDGPISAAFARPRAI